MLSLLFATLAWGCSPPRNHCSVDLSYYRFKVVEIRSSLPAEILKTSRKTDKDTYVYLENVSDKPMYFLSEANFEEHSIVLEGKRWNPFKAEKGKESHCNPDWGLEKIALANIANAKWRCEAEHDSCGRANNPHPLEMRIYQHELAKSGLDSAKRVKPSEGLHKYHQDILYEGRLETVDVDWTIELNPNYQKVECSSGVVAFSTCGEDCERATNRMMEKAGSKFETRMEGDFRLSGKTYRVKVLNRKLPKDVFPDWKNRFKDELWVATHRKPEELKAVIKEGFADLEKEASGSMVPLKIILAGLHDKLDVEAKVWAFAVEVEEK